MYIPSSFKDAIANAFYDKNIAIINMERSKDAEGGALINGGDVIGMFTGNVRTTRLAQIREQYGLDYDIDIAVSTHYQMLRIGDHIGYNTKIYEVRECIPFDSHFMIVGKCI